MAKKTTAMNTAAIMSIFFIAMGIGTITPALQTIIAAFPDLSISTIYLVSTLPSLMVIPATLLAGAIVGSKVKYKTLASIGILLFVVAGVAPAFANDFTVILIERAVFGIGLGIISPLGNALILGVYGDDKRAGMLGAGTLMMNIGGIVLQFLGGAMAGIGWNFAFYPHALGIISLVLVMLFLPEPPKMEVPEGAEKPKIKIPGGIWVLSILFGIVMFISYPLLMGMSTLLTANSIGGPTASAVVLSFFTVGGMIGGAIFAPSYKVMKRFIVGVGLALMAIGAALVIYTYNIVLITIGMTLVGIGFSYLMPSVFMIIGMMSSPQAVPMCSSILMALMNLFAFLYTFWNKMITNITGDALMMPMVAGMIIAAIGTVLFFIINPFPKAPAAPPAQE
ncbi:MAG: MFS transporter [Anaerofustis sp.]